MKQNFCFMFSEILSIVSFVLLLKLHKRVNKRQFMTSVTRQSWLDGRV